MSASRQLAAVAAVLLLVIAAGAGGVTAAPTTPEDNDDSDLPVADDAYVTEDGDVVLAYENDSDGSEVQFGLDVSRSVFHALVVTNATDTDATGQATAVLDGDRLAANGSLAAPQPDSLTSLTFDAAGHQTSENAAFNASLEATLNDSRRSATSAITSANANGTVEVAPKTFTANGRFDADLRSQMGPAQHQAFSLRETDDGYVLEGAQNHTVSRFTRDRWSSRERAEKHIESQYSSLAESLGGTSDVTLDSYSFTNTSAGARVDVEFTVQYTDVDEGLKQQISTSLADSEDYNLTQAEADRVAEQVAELNVDEVDLTFDQTSESVEGAFTAKISNYDGAARAALTVVSSMETDEEVEFQTELDRVKKTLDARQDASLVQTYSFDVSVDSPASAPTTVTASASYRTENWAAYREALTARGIDPANAEYELHATTENGEIVADASATVQKEGLLRETSNALLNSTNSSDGETQRAIKAFQDADLRRAKVDVSLADQEVRIEAGAAFEDLTALRDAWRASSGTDLKVASAVGRTEGDKVKTYVTVVDAVDPDANESEVRKLSPVGQDTEVHLPGTYNRTFPETNTTQAYDYLGVEPESSSDDGGSPIGQPGFGLGLTGLALLGAALLAARRQD